VLLRAAAKMGQNSGHGREEIGVEQDRQKKMIDLMVV